MALDQMGGRKFLLTLFIIAVGTAVQILSPHGVSESFVALLLGAAATFGATNAYVTKKAMEQQPAEPAQPQPANSSHVDTELMGAYAAEVGTLKKQVAEVNAKADMVADGLTKVAESAQIASNLAKAVATAIQPPPR